MNKQEHFGTAILFMIILGALFYWLGLFDYLLNNFYYTLPLYIGVIFPDILEPAVHWDHRGKFHSKRCLKIFSLLLVWSITMTLLFPWFLYLLFFKIGYILHLLGDWTTPVGLP